jgi:hypothetical protein
MSTEVWAYPTESGRAEIASRGFSGSPHSLEERMVSFDQGPMLRFFKYLRPEKFSEKFGVFD